MSPATPGFAKALLVEDEPMLGSTLRVSMRKLGIPVRHATTLAQARELIASDEPDFILLDRGLPDGDGIALCAELRESGFRGSILILTAAGEVDSRVDGLNAGADDYLAKPFSWNELSARIHALARRQQPAAARGPAPACADLPWTLDESGLRIRGPRGWTQLTPLEFKLARHLMDAEGAIVSRDALLRDVWGFSLLPKTRTVDHFVGRLRKLFELDVDQPKHFLTVRGAGYRFIKG